MTPTIQRGCRIKVVRRSTVPVHDWKIGTTGKVDWIGPNGTVHFWNDADGGYRSTHLDLIERIHGNRRGKVRK